MEKYLPNDEAQLLEWLKNFSSLLPSIGVDLGITPAEISSLNALIIGVKSDLRNDRLNGEDKAKKKENMSKFLSVLVVKMKNHPDYTNSQGEKLRV